jgi:hypothetical protein
LKRKSRIKVEGAKEDYTEVEMKRKRELEKVSEISSVIEELSMMAKLKPGDNHDATHIPTKTFLHVCNLVIQILGWFFLCTSYSHSVFLSQ